MTKDTLYQEGTMQMLSEKLLEGTLSLKNLMQHGNYGIGTGPGIAGELIILDGKAYHILGSGRIEEPPATFSVPFANAHEGDFKKFGEYQAINLHEALDDICEKMNGNNQFFAVLIKGKFSNIHTRSADGANKPYPSLTKIAEGQHEFFAQNIDGQLLSYHAPKVFQGVTVEGFHSHFLADDLSIGGHVLGGRLGDVEVYIQPISNFVEHLPINNQTYLDADLNDLSDLDADIKAAEEQRK
ncbi:acetolactate decarboxylase [Lactobacillaceae bacterium L1_55_11]|nr:acetolactate decarboxylase [Lactobacillaceae bacterium L1_55_11]